MKQMTREQVGEYLRQDDGKMYSIRLTYRSGERFWTGKEFAKMEVTADSFQNFNMWRKEEVAKQYEIVAYYYNSNLIDTDNGNLEIVRMG